MIDPSSDQLLAPKTPTERGGFICHETLSERNQSSQHNEPIRVDRNSVSIGQLLSPEIENVAAPHKGLG